MGSVGAEQPGSLEARASILSVGVEMLNERRAPLMEDLENQLEGFNLISLVTGGHCYFLSRKAAD